MPPNWTFPERLIALLIEARAALGTLNGIGQQLDDSDLLLRPLQNREAISSSGIEGTFVTPEQLLLYELDPKEPDSPDGKVADWKEVFNYGWALKRGCQMLEEENLPLCNRIVCEMHKALMSGVRGERKTPGDFRRMQVQIGSSARYVPPPPPEVPILIGDLEAYINSEDDRFDPLVRCYLVHYQFEAIHPFADGNGRVGRALLALMIYKWLNHTRPWLYMSSFFERYEREYSNLLFRISTHGDWEQWIEYCLRGTLTQATDAIRRCHRFNKLKKDYHERDINATPRSHKIIDQLFVTPVVTVASIKKQLNVTYHTARSDLERLQKSGILTEMQGIQPRSFFARELMQAAFTPQEDDYWLDGEIGVGEPGAGPMASSSNEPKQPS
jgi:Fic family protein